VVVSRIGRKSTTKCTQFESHAVEAGTMIQAGRPRVRFPVSLNFSVLPPHLLGGTEENHQNSHLDGLGAKIYTREFLNTEEER
jgi:hypothetical protein